MDSYYVQTEKQEHLVQREFWSTNEAASQRVLESIWVGLRQIGVYTMSPCPD